MVLEPVGRLHVFVIHHIVGTHQRQRRLVMKVLSLTLHLLMCFRQQRDRCASAVAPLLATSHAALGRFQRPFGLAIAAGMDDAHTARQSSEGFQSKINARFLAGHWHWLRWDIGA
jgi:hypothetical protein